MRILAKYSLGAWCVSGARYREQHWNKVLLLSFYDMGSSMPF